MVHVRGWDRQEGTGFGIQAFVASVERGDCRPFNLAALRSCNDWALWGSESQAGLRNQVELRKGLLNEPLSALRFLQPLPYTFSAELCIRENHCHAHRVVAQALSDWVWNQAAMTAVKGHLYRRPGEHEGPVSGRSRKRNGDSMI